MEDLEVELKNYRCFPIDEPARFAISGGFTAFVGANNAGKTTALRFFYEFRQLFELLSQPSGNLIQMLTESGDDLRLNGVADRQAVFHSGNDLNLEITLRIARRPPTSLIPSELTFGIDRHALRTYLRIPGLAEFDAGHASFNEMQLRANNIPVAELEPWFNLFRELRTAIYLGSFRNALNVTGGTHFDVATGAAFVAEWDRLKAGESQSDAQVALDVTQEIRRIFEFDTLEINANDQNTTLQLIIDGHRLSLDEVGGGLAHFMIALATVAIHKPALILVDEPELNLHAALQLDFLTTLGQYASSGTVFATHSIGLARAAAQSVYSVRRTPGSGRSRIVRLEQTPDLAQFLGELGIGGITELGATAVLMVEGPTDVTAFQQLLRLYGIEHQVVLLPLGGASSITADGAAHLHEVRRLCPIVHAAIDSERTASTDDPHPRCLAFQEACEQLDIPCHILERRALENYFTQQAVQAALGQSFNPLGEFQKLSDSTNGWRKPDNWKIAARLTKGEIDATDLAQPLAALRAALEAAPQR